MNSNRSTARLVGALFLFSNVTFLVGAFGLIESVLGAPEYLTLLHAKRAGVVVGVLLEIINGFAYIGIGAFMFPIFRQRFESLALGYFGLRLVEFVTQVLAGIAVLSLLTLSESFVGAGAPQAGNFEMLGASLLEERAWAFQMLGLVFGTSALVFYSMLYRMKLLPSFLTIWGLVGAALVLVNTVFDMIGVNLGFFSNLGVLMLLNELFLGVWLIVRGFNTSGGQSAMAKQV